MNTGSFMGESLNHIDVLESMLLPCVANQQPVQCVGAVVLWFDDAAVVLRSALRYGKQGLGTFLHKQSVEPAVTFCSHEEAQWLIQAIGVGWHRLPGCGRPVISIHLALHALQMLVNTIGRHDLTEWEQRTVSLFWWRQRC